MKYQRCKLYITYALYTTITADLLNVCGRYRVADPDIDLWPISTLPVAVMVFYVADMVCGRYRCNSPRPLPYFTTDRA